MNPNDQYISGAFLNALKVGGLYLWNGAAVFLSLFYLTGTVAKSLVIAAVVLVSSFIGFGSRRLVQVGFAITVLAVLVSYGFPHPNGWLTLAKSVPSTINYAWNHQAN